MNLSVSIIIATVPNNHNYTSPNSIFFRKFVFAYYKRLAGLYVQKLLKRLINFIKGLDSLDEQSFFIIVKYIMDSGSIVPFPPRHYHSVIGNYCFNKFNNKPLYMRYCVMLLVLNLYIEF